MSEEIKYTLNVQSVINPLAKEKGETNFVLVSNGTADFDRVISEMMAVNPGLERETIEMVVKLEHRIIQKLTMNGMRVSNGLFSAVATPKGKGGSTWDPKVNELNISITQGNSWRDAIRDTTVNVIGYKSDVMYITTITNAATRATNGTATQGRPLKVEGNYLKVVGSDPSVGIYFIDAEGEETQVTEDFWSVNQPKTLSFVVPAGLENGVYTLRITTQYSGKNNTYVRTPRTVERTVYVGVEPTLGQAILSGRDGSTGAVDSTGTRGGEYILGGNGIMLLGADGESGGALKLQSETGIPETIKAIATNTADMVIFTIPNDLAEGKYTLTIETYYSPEGVRENPITLTAPFELTLV